MLLGIKSISLFKSLLYLLYIIKEHINRAFVTTVNLHNFVHPKYYNATSLLSHLARLRDVAGNEETLLGMKLAKASVAGENTSNGLRDRRHFKRRGWKNQQGRKK